MYIYSYMLSKNILDDLQINGVSDNPSDTANAVPPPLAQGRLGFRRRFPCRDPLCGFMRIYREHKLK